MNGIPARAIKAAVSPLAIKGKGVTHTPCCTPVLRARVTHTATCDTHVTVSYTLIGLEESRQSAFTLVPPVIALGTSIAVVNFIILVMTTVM